MSTILKALRQSQASRPDRPHLVGGIQGPYRRSRRARDLAWVSLAVLFFAVAAFLAWRYGDMAGEDTGGERSPRVSQVSLAPSPEPESVPTESDGAGGTDAPAKPAEPESAKPADSRPSDRSGDAPTAEPEQPETGGPATAVARARPDPEPAPAEPAEPERQLDPYAMLPRLRDLADARLKGLPELSLNAHVYAEEASERFVLINLRRYREGEQLAPGLRVAAIFPGGVVLEDGEGRFVLPRP